MKALVKERPEPGLALRDIDPPEITQPDDVKFQVAYCAICEGERKVYDWNEGAAVDTTLQLPTVLGHEVSGVVTEVGSDVQQYQPGDRVVVDPFIPCGKCEACRTGDYRMCDDREIYGKRRGAFAEFAVVPERSVCPLPDSVSLEAGTILENFGIAVHALEQAPQITGDFAVVIGAGPIGIMAG